MGDPLQGKAQWATHCRVKRNGYPGGPHRSGGSLPGERTAAAAGMAGGPSRPESEMKRSAPLSREWSWGGWSQAPVRKDGAAGGNDA